MVVTIGELPSCVLVTGMPAAGKSTVTGLAARLPPRAACVKADDVNELILSGRAWRLGTRPVLLVTLAPTVEVCQQRNRMRTQDERWEFDDSDRLAADLSRHFRDVGWWFDTSALTPQPAADHRVRKAADRASLTLPLI